MNKSEEYVQDSEKEKDDNQEFNGLIKFFSL